MEKYEIVKENSKIKNVFFKNSDDLHSIKRIYYNGQTIWEKDINGYIIYFKSYFSSFDLTDEDFYDYRKHGTSLDCALSVGTFRDSVNYYLPSPNDVGLELEEGQQFYCWKAIRPQNSSVKYDYYKDIFTNGEGRRQEINQNCVWGIEIVPCFYPVLARYGWTYENNQSSSDWSIYSSSDSYSNCIYQKIMNAKDFEQYVSSDCLSIDDGQRILFKVQNNSENDLKNVYLNGQLFCGVDQTLENWTANKDTLFRGITSSDFIDKFMIKEPAKTGSFLANDGTGLDIYFNVTDAHVSSDNLMHISCQYDVDQPDKT